MPAATPTKKAAAPKAKPAHGSYQDMITDAIINLKERNGSSRQALKKYVKANNTLNTSSDKMFDNLFNKALKAGVDKGVFEQPKGPSGGTKLAKKKPEAAKAASAAAKKDTAAKTEKKPAAKKAATTTTKKAAAAKPAAEKKAPVKKAAAATTKKAPAAKKTAEKAEKPETVLTKTKSGRVAKAQKPAVAKKAAPKKAAPKKAATKA